MGKIFSREEVRSPLETLLKVLASNYSVLPNYIFIQN